MKITILSVGKLKEKYWKQAIAEYEKRLGPYTKVEIIEVPDEKAPENMSDKEIEQVKEKEGQRLLAKIKPQSTVITLEIQGKMLSSEGLAKRTTNTHDPRTKRLCICHRRIKRPTPRRLKPKQLRTLLQQNDLPTPNDASSLNRANLPRLQNHARRGLS